MADDNSAASGLLGAIRGVFTGQNIMDSARNAYNSIKNSGTYQRITDPDRAAQLQSNVDRNQAEKNERATETFRQQAARDAEDKQRAASTARSTSRARSAGRR